MVDERSKTDSIWESISQISDIPGKKGEIRVQKQEFKSENVLDAQQ